MEIPVSPLLQFILIAFVLISIRTTLGKYIFEIVQGQRSNILLHRIESFFIHEKEGSLEQTFRQYLSQCLVFHVIFFLVLIALQLFLSKKPLGLALMVNNGISLLTNTNWQASAPEEMYTATFQMTGVVLAQFLSPAVGITVFLSLSRAFAKKKKELSSCFLFGNFYGDMIRVTLGVLLPLSLISALILLVMGIPQHFQGSLALQSHETAQTLIAGGAIASQTAIKILGTNGGGYFMSNAAHPFENPTQWSHLFQMILMLLLATGLTDTFSRIVSDPKQGKAFFFLMLSVLGLTFLLTLIAEGDSPPVFAGIESRFEAGSSLLYNFISSATGTGATASNLEGFSPLTILIMLTAMMLGMIFGASGTGLMNLLFYCLFSIFLAGLIIGRTPEFLGKKIDGRDIKCLGVGLFIQPIIILLCLMISTTFGHFEASSATLSKLTYTFTSTAYHNGSSYGDLDAATPFMLWMTTFSMLIGRIGILGAALALAKFLGSKQKIPRNRGTFPTNTPLFMIFVAVSGLMSLILIMLPTFVVSLGMDYVKGL